MPLVVEDGTGLANAESYASVTFADAYFAARGIAAWSALDTTRKEQLLRIASDYVTDLYGRAFVGTKYVSGQSLAWPRYGNQVGYWGLEAEGVPLKVQEAVAELALVASSQPLIANTTRGKKRVKIGPLEVEYDGNAAMQTQFVSASLKLSPYLKAGTGSGQVRLQRA